jgi:hypothetical protein
MPCEYFVFSGPMQTAYPVLNILTVKLKSGIQGLNPESSCLSPCYKF